MGLTNNANNTNILNPNTNIENTKIISLAGNPNVGKSSIFNTITGLKQHTGNWSGKTVSNSCGNYKYNNENYSLIDLPGLYSIISDSYEESIARDFICFGNAISTVIVCDASNIERNLNLVLQILEITPNVIICLNLIDEANKKNIKLDLEKIKKVLKVPVVTTSAKTSLGIPQLLDKIEKSTKKPITEFNKLVEYPSEIEYLIDKIQNILNKNLPKNLPLRWLSIKILENDTQILKQLYEKYNFNINEIDEIFDIINSIKIDNLSEKIAYSINKQSEMLYEQFIINKGNTFSKKYMKIETLLTSNKTGIPIMILTLALILWITITFSNYPSQILSNFLFSFETPFLSMLNKISFPLWLSELLVFGIYRVLTWVISVMLPPMAIFFPLFTILEDLGYLPRVAFNLDNFFKKCGSCGKQALTLCMGLGCNAAGITSCRIISSPREKLIAILTNNFVPCNGRFPILISIISMFCISGTFLSFETLLSSILLTFFIVLSVAFTFLASKFLSKTILKGVPSNFTLELPPYRTPQFKKIIVHSIFNKILFVLCRAVVVAIPAGVIIWIMANFYIGDLSLLAICNNFLDPFAKLIGLDGVILMAFILGLPANEIVIPIIIMSYLSKGSLIEFDNLYELKNLLILNGWTIKTAICVMLFSILHWPCSTTLLTIKKETNSIKWTVVAFLLPTIMGFLICFIFNTVLTFLFY